MNKEHGTISTERESQSLSLAERNNRFATTRHNA